MSFPHGDSGASLSAFVRVREADSVRAVDPAVNGNNAFDESDNPYSMSAMLRVTDPENDTDVWDKTDDPQSWSAFVRQTNSPRAINPDNNEETPRDTDFAQEDETKNGSSTDIGDLAGEQTVKQMPLQHALTLPETTTIYEACCQLAAGKGDALVLTDLNGSLSGILTYKDIVKRVIARGIDVANTPVSDVMTKDPIFVLSDALCVEAMQKMVQGEVKQLPAIENGEVIGLLYLQICVFTIAENPERTYENYMVLNAAGEAHDKRFYFWGNNNA
ncbi:hypothetical protein L2E82_36353 [Cichorium intybus]|uniref:Uncharacterized protein n=1 Tax=Cichorium intybus TaxID=13427 RepID=A0ACB9BRE5_CICIN|nr:hypothetical protein L2E82_36353 [Cichorium intybus]